MKKWSHEFYQIDYTHPTCGSFYQMQRAAIAILEEVKKIKNGLYEARVVEIQPKEEYRIMGVAGGCHYQYRIGETFHLRQHRETSKPKWYEKEPKPREWWSTYNSRNWYDVRWRDNDYTENFSLIDDK
jgi:hypothetical protein